MAIIAVKTKREQPFRRAGFVFTMDEVLVDTAEIGPDRAAAIRAEVEMLEVRDVEAAPAAAAGSATAEVSTAAVCPPETAEPVVVDVTGRAKRGRR